MATKQSTVDELLDRLAEAGSVTARKMFGEYCVYLDEKPIALVCDDCLFVKPTSAGRQLMPDAAEGPPYPGAKAHLMFPPETWEDRQTLCALLRATFHELPPPKPRKKKAARKSQTKKSAGKAKSAAAGPRPKANKAKAEKRQ